jgi:hypothetical protein
MTLSSRNCFFKAGIAVSLGTLIVITALAFKIAPLYPGLVAGASRRPLGIIQGLAGLITGPSAYVPLITMAAAAVYALITQILIFYFFEKTQAPEILFFAIFAFSCAFEGIRVTVPLRTVYDLPGVYLIMAARVLFFARYAGIFSLFAGSLYSAGLEMQKQGRVILITIAAALVFALGVPVDGLSWDSSLTMINGYSRMFALVEGGIVLITMASFLTAAYSRGSREYLFIGGGSLLVCTGKDILLRADTWITPLPALAVLVLGTWFICTQIRRIYLWL